MLCRPPKRPQAPILSRPVCAPATLLASRWLLVDPDGIEFQGARIFLCSAACGDVPPHLGVHGFRRTAFRPELARMSRGLTAVMSSVTRWELLFGREDDQAPRGRACAPARFRRAASGFCGAACRIGNVGLGPNFCRITLRKRPYPDEICISVAPMPDPLRLSPTSASTRADLLSPRGIRPPGAFGS